MSEFLPPYDSEFLPPYNMNVERIMFKIQDAFGELLMHTTNSSTDALTFVHDGSPDGGDLQIVVNLTKAERYNETEKAKSEYGYNKIRVEDESLMGENYVTLTVPYNEIRDFILGKLRDREISKLEQMSADDLVRYYLS